VQATPARAELRFGAGVSSASDTLRAVEHACGQALDGLAAAGGGSGGVDTAFLFFSAHHIGKAPALAAAALKRLNTRALIGVSTAAAIGGTSELENAPGVSVLAGQMPGVTAHPFTLEDLPQPPDEGEAGDQTRLALMAERMGVGADLRCTLLFADPFSVPLVKLLPAMNKARALAGKGGAGSSGGAPLVGGMASAASTPGGNVLLLNDRVLHAGGVGLSLRGNLHVDAVVSQGCRPFGPTMVVTKARNNLVLELGGRSAVEAVEEAVLALGDRATEMLGGGLFIGRVIDEYKGRFGRNDFLIRAVMGVDPARGALAVADRVRVGQTIRLHCRDATTAHEDLALLLDAQKLYDKPRGALLITCNGRGRRLFAKTQTPAPHMDSHDAQAVARAFAQLQGGESLSKPGKAFEPQPASVPLAGCFAAGEIGPVGDESFVHGHAACLALFRER
jgi:small ligand-binding sensory domain FIST